MENNTKDSTSRRLIFSLTMLGLIFFFYKFILKSKKKPRIFISHSWTYRKDYDNLIRILDQEGFRYYNHSISEEKANKYLNTKQIEHKVWKHLFFCRCLIVFAGRDTFRYWIKKEVFYASKLRKKIIVVKDSGINNIPKYLKIKANTIINFENKAIINSIIKN